MEEGGGRIDGKIMIRRRQEEGEGEGVRGWRVRGKRTTCRMHSSSELKLSPPRKEEGRKEEGRKEEGRAPSLT